MVDAQKLVESKEFKKTLREMEQLKKEKVQPKLEVVIREFPESNGKHNWTAMLMRVEPWDGLPGNANGITLARGEFLNRVAYEAECTKFLIGLRDNEPDILDFIKDVKTREEWGVEFN